MVPDEDADVTSYAISSLSTHPPTLRGFMIQHSPGCPLYPTHWLRHAVAATGRLIQDPPAAGADRVSAEALTDALAHFAELPGWETVTLKDVADHADWVESSPNRDLFLSKCTCGAASA